MLTADRRYGLCETRARSSFKRIHQAAQRRHKFADAAGVVFPDIAFSMVYRA